MVNTLKGETGREFIVPDAYRRFDSLDEFPAMESLRIIRGVDESVQFVFDPVNEDHLNRLQVLRGLSLHLNRLIADRCKGVPVAVHKKFRPSKHLLRVTVLLRPVFSSSPCIIGSQNDITIGTNSVVLCVHCDEEGNLQTIRLMNNQSESSYAKKILIDDIFLEIKECLYYEDGPVDIEDLAAIVSNSLRRNTVNRLPLEVTSLEDALDFAVDPFQVGDLFFFASMYIDYITRGRYPLSSDVVDSEVAKIMKVMPELDRNRVRNLFFRKKF